MITAATPSNSSSVAEPMTWAVPVVDFEPDPVVGRVGVAVSSVTGTGAVPVGISVVDAEVHGARVACGSTDPHPDASSTPPATAETTSVERRCMPIYLGRMPGTGVGSRVVRYSRRRQAADRVSGRA